MDDGPGASGPDAPTTRAAREAPGGAPAAGSRADALVYRERHAQFLLALADATRPLEDPAAIVATTLERLRAHLGASQVFYAEFDAAETFILRGLAATPGVEPRAPAGRLPVDALGPDIAAALRAGRTFVQRDVVAHLTTSQRGLVPGDSVYEELAARAALARAAGIRATLRVPLRKGGRLVAGVGLQYTDPRDWTGDEIALAQEVVERVWDALARADAAAALRESEARLRAALAEAERLREAAERERAAAERERAAAVEANRAKSQFLASMSHELRTPLNAIQGHVQLLELGLHGPLTQGQREALGRTQAAGRHLLGLVTDVLDYAKLEAGKVEFAVRATALAEVVRQAVPLIEPQCRLRGLELTVTLPEDRGEPPLHVWADQERLVQALLNLLANAVKFTPARQPTGAPGRVALEVGDALGAAATGADEMGGSASEQAWVRVRDTGIGIARERTARIFEPFVQARPGYAREHQGVGLGLAISRDLVRGMGGALGVESEEGVGSTFTIALRRVRTAAGIDMDRRARTNRRHGAPDRRGDGGERERRTPTAGRARHATPADAHGQRAVEGPLEAGGPTAVMPDS